MATIVELKEKLGIGQLNLNTAKDAEGNDTEWFRHWENDSRVAVSIHKDTYAKIKADVSISTLALQEEEREGAQGAYKAMRIVMFTPSEATL